MILATATASMFMTLPGQTAGIAVFLEQIIADLTLQRTTVSLLYLIGTLIAAFTLTLVGWAIDRYGPRRAASGIVILFICGCLVMSSATGPLSLLLGLILVRAFGQGALPLVSMHSVNLWFIRNRGMAVGIAGLGIALGTAAFPPLIELMMGNYGWRTTYAMLGGLIALVVLPLVVTFFRDHPESYGLLPDGDTVTSRRENEHRADDTGSEPALTLPQAQRTATYWLFVLGGVAVSCFGTALVFHHYAIMTANGVDRTVAALMFVPFGIAMATSNLLTGLAMDRLAPRYLLSFNLALLVTALACASRVDSPALVIAYGVGIGALQGMHGALQAGVYAHYFGRRHLGVVRGFASTLSVGGSAAGPFLFALGFDLFDDQVTTLVVATAVPLVIAVTAPFLKPVRA
ncbi:MAG: MFS transporter [Trueperaceae bacterium]